jgi:uncharacterized protein (DUF488 family)
MKDKGNILYTIGHSTHSIEELIGLLKEHAVTAVCDVRSSPYSQYNPQFNRESLQKALKASGIAYVFLGGELGARTDDPSCYMDGKIQFDLLAGTDRFQQGLDRLRMGIRKFRISLLCAEKDPIMCHRMILVCRHVRGDDVSILHILEDGTLESNEESESRLMKSLKIAETNLFMAYEELVEMAYDGQGERIAHVEKDESHHA